MTPPILLRHGTLLVHQQDDSVKALAHTDLLVQDGLIAAIGNNIQVPANTQVIDCAGKFISPGFVDTHHHLWQTQLKGRHADETLLDYMFTGFFQSFNYEPHDIFYGQLSGALEALDAGTTCVLDHSHGCYTAEHAQKAMDATVISGIRAVLALAPALKMSKWTQETAEFDQDVMPSHILQIIEQWAKEGGTDGINGRVHPGFGFDLFFLPKDMVQSIWIQAQAAGAKLITSHVVPGVILGRTSTPQLVNDYGLLRGPDNGGIRWVVSHGTGLNRADIDLLAQAGTYVSTTPETEAQMGHGLLVALEPGVKASLGIDCHSNNSSSILIQARAALQLKRQEVNAKIIGRGGALRKLPGSTTEAFNLATIEGARAMGMENEIGSLAVGKKADIVIFDYATSVSMLCAGDYDPLVSVLRHSDARDVDTVIVGGQIRKQGGKLLDVVVDGESIAWQEVAKRTRASQVEVQKRIGRVNTKIARAELIKAWHIDDSKIFDEA